MADVGSGLGGDGGDDDDYKRWRYQAQGKYIGCNSDSEEEEDDEEGPGTGRNGPLTNILKRKRGEGTSTATAKLLNICEEQRLRDSIHNATRNCINRRKMGLCKKDGVTVRMAGLGKLLGRLQRGYNMGTERFAAVALEEAERQRGRLQSLLAESGNPERLGYNISFATNLENFLRSDNVVASLNSAVVAEPTCAVKDEEGEAPARKRVAAPQPPKPKSSKPKKPRQHKGGQAAMDPVLSMPRQGAPALPPSKLPPVAPAWTTQRPAPARPPRRSALPPLLPDPLPSAGAQAFPRGPPAAPSPTTHYQFVPPFPYTSAAPASALALGSAYQPPMVKGWASRSLSLLAIMTQPHQLASTQANTSTAPPTLAHPPTPTPWMTQPTRSTVPLMAPTVLTRRLMPPGMHRPSLTLQSATPPVPPESHPIKEEPPPLASCRTSVAPVEGPPAPEAPRATMTTVKAEPIDETAPLTSDSAAASQYTAQSTVPRSARALVTTTLMPTGMSPPAAPIAMAYPRSILYNPSLAASISPAPPSQPIYQPWYPPPPVDPPPSPAPLPAYTYVGAYPPPPSYPPPPRTAPAFSPTDTAHDTKCYKTPEKAAQSTSSTPATPPTASPPPRPMTSMPSSPVRKLPREDGDNEKPGQAE